MPKNSCDASEKCIYIEKFDKKKTNIMKIDKDFTIFKAYKNHLIFFSY